MPFRGCYHGAGVDAEWDSDLPGRFQPDGKDVFGMLAAAALEKARAPETARRSVDLAPRWALAIQPVRFEVSALLQAPGIAGPRSSSSVSTH